VALSLRFVHALAAITWIGDMLFVALVLVPVVRAQAHPALRSVAPEAVPRRSGYFDGVPALVGL
jgi:uncharacterized membrane protein